jgi:hypothetical protein
MDPANRNTTLRCQIPQDTLQAMHFVESSYGHLIFHLRWNCLIDVFTGAKASLPRLPLSNGLYESYYGGILAAPLTLLISTHSSLIGWLEVTRGLNYGFLQKYSRLCNAMVSSSPWVVIRGSTVCS